MPDARAPAEMAEVARIADLRLEQWYRERGLDLPLDVQAEFNAMAFEAIAGDRVRTPDAVMDELIAELDQRLGRIQSQSPKPGRTRPTLLQRLKRPFARDTRRH